MKLADEIWVAVATLHRKYPKRHSFSADEIRAQIARVNGGRELRRGVQPHLHQHMVANEVANSGRYRMLVKLADGSFRLFRPGDVAHAGRHGKITPKRSELPEKYHSLLDWYNTEYVRPSIDDDPILRMWGVGKQAWERLGGGDRFIALLRSGWGDSE